MDSVVPKQLDQFLECSAQVPPALIRPQPDIPELPYELRIVKAIALREFGSATTETSDCNVPSSLYCYKYAQSSKLVTRYAYYHQVEKLDVTYRMGFTDTYLNVPKDVVDVLTLGNEPHQVLFENLITKYSPIRKRTCFRPVVKSSVAEHVLASSIRAISGRVTENALGRFEELLSLRNILVAIVKTHKPVCGDEKRLPDGRHIITINDTDNRYSFMLTLLHELAHVFAPQTEGARAHDSHWKLMYGNLLVDFFHFFPSALARYLVQLACNPQSTQDKCEEYLTRHCEDEDFQQLSSAQIDLIRINIELGLPPGKPFKL